MYPGGNFIGPMRNADSAYTMPTHPNPVYCQNQPLPPGPGWAPNKEIRIHSTAHRPNARGEWVVCMANEEACETTVLFGLREVEVQF